MAGFKVIVWSDPGDKAKGLQFMKPVPPGHLFVFTDVFPGTTFHTKNVTEPIDIIFLSAGGEVLERATLEAPKAVIQAPPRTSVAVEAKEGELSRMGLEIGKKLNMQVLLGTPRLVPRKTGEAPPAKKEEKVEDVEDMEDEGEEVPE